MNNFFDLKQNALTVMEESKGLVEKLGYPTGSHTIESIMEQFRNKKLMVVVAGEAKRGKSTLLNALLGAVVPIFPVDMNVCTNVVTIVHYGKTEKIETVIGEGNSYRTEKVSREDIPDYVSEKGNPNNYKNVSALNVWTPNELLKEGIVFVDTPGVGSLNVAHAETTYSFLPNADLLLFVSDADAGFTETELDFLKRGYQYCKNVIFPLTKKDTNPNYKVIMEDNRKKISNILQIPEEEVQIIPVSSTAKLRSIEKNSEKIYIRSNYPQFENAIWTNIAVNRGNILLLPYLLGVKEELFKAIEDTEIQYQVLQKNDKKEAEHLKAALEDKIAKLKKLEKDGADWQNKIWSSCSALKRKTDDVVGQYKRKSIDCLKECAKKKKTKICKEKVYSQLTSDINSILMNGSLDIQDTIKKSAQTDACNIEKEMNFDIKAHNADVGFKTDENVPSITVIGRGGMEVAINTVKKTSKDGTVGTGIGMAVGAAAGAIVGTAFFPGVGTEAGMYVGQEIGAVVGGLAGGVKGLLDGLKKYDKQDADRVVEAFERHIDLTAEELKRKSEECINEVYKSIKENLKKELEKHESEANEQIKRHKDNIELRGNEMEKKLGELEEQDGILKDQKKKIEKLEKDIENLKEVE